MINAYSSVNNFIKSTSLESSLFKNLAFVPAVGLVVQVWKNITLHSGSNFEAPDLSIPNESDVSRQTEKLKEKIRLGWEYNLAGNQKIANMNSNTTLYYRGFCSDVMVMIIGIALISFSKSLPAFAIVGNDICLCGMASLVVRSSSFIYSLN